jgi:hypothetical protein
VNSPRRILSVLLILGLALGTMGRDAQRTMLVGMHDMTAAAMDHDAMPGCDGCIDGDETGKGMAMMGCQSGICVVLPAMLSGSLDAVSLASDAFASVVPTVQHGLSPPPDHPPPISAFLV